MKDYKRKLKEWYDSTAEKYDSWGTRKGEYSTETKSIELLKFNKLLDLINIRENTKILDVATGTGTYLIEVLKRDGFGYGVDISRNMIKQLNKKISKSRLNGKIKIIKEGDAEKLDFKSDYFDVILCIGMFEYYPLEKVKKFLKEMARAGKKGSYLIVDFPNKRNKEVYKFQKKERSVGHEIYIYDKKIIDKFLKGLGLRVIKSEVCKVEIQYLLKINKQTKKI